MFRVWRNVHLSLGIAFFFVAALFAASSVVIIYRPWFPSGPQRSERTLQLTASATPRAAAMELMRRHGLKGDLRNIRENGEAVNFAIMRPGEHVNIVYTPASGQAKLDTRRFNLYETLVQLHVNHGFWHEFLPANIWSALSLGVSLGLILLGASGIYLWYKHPQERRVGNVLLGIGFLVPVAALVMMRSSG